MGYYKDLLELAARLVSGEEEHAAKVARQEWRMEHKGANHAPRKAAKHARLREWRAALKDAADPEAARKERAAHFAGVAFPVALLHLGVSSLGLVSGPPAASGVHG